jgi:hypothetical protein
MTFSPESPAQKLQMGNTDLKNALRWRRGQSASLLGEKIARRPATSSPDRLYLYQVLPPTPKKMVAFFAKPRSGLSGPGYLRDNEGILASFAL